MAAEGSPFGTVPPRKVAVALQGGGSHGAFTWGVLDRLLQDPTIAIDGVTGTSAGAMNAVVLAHGLAQGGRRARARRCGGSGNRSGRRRDWRRSSRR